MASADANHPAHVDPAATARPRRAPQPIVPLGARIVQSILSTLVRQVTGLRVMANVVPSADDDRTENDCTETNVAVVDTTDTSYD